jgi:hypothetical protein
MKSVSGKMRMTALLALVATTAILVSSGVSRASVIVQTVGNLTLTITSQGTPDNTNGDTAGLGGSTNLSANGWTGFLFTLTTSVPAANLGGVSGIDAGGGGGSLETGFTGKFLQQWGLKRTGGASPSGTVKFNPGTSPLATDTNTNSGLSPSTGQFAVDSHWLITDQTYAQELAVSAVNTPKEDGPALNTLYVGGGVNPNPWANGATGIDDDVPLANNGLGTAWSTDTSLTAVFATNNGSQPQTMELIYLIIPTSGVGSYNFQANDASTATILEQFTGTFSVPEPAAFALLGGAGMVFLGFGRKQKKVAAAA